MLPIIKTYKVDYDFIIKNYLNPEMWTKTWTLFVYKEWKVSLRLSYINCQNEKICFDIYVEDTGNERTYFDDWGEDIDKRVWSVIDYSLKVNDINFLKRAINNKIYDLIGRLEEKYIKGSSIYREVKNSSYIEEVQLRKIAEDFLDENDVKNDDIREVYIDNYVEKNSRIDDKLNEIIEESAYTIFTDFYLVFANSTGQENLINQAKGDTEKVSNIDLIKTAVDEYMAYLETEEFEEDAQSNLEEV